MRDSIVRTCMSRVIEGKPSLWAQSVPKCSEPTGFAILFTFFAAGELSNGEMTDWPLLI